MKLLVIEDEVKTAQSIKQGLEELGYEVDMAFDGDVGLYMAQRFQYQLIISDIILPNLSGLDICKTLRDNKVTTPFIFLTALGSISDKVKGFEIGSDDYLVKPFEFEELILRIKALLRRSSESTPKIAKDNSHIILFADLKMDMNTKEIWREGKLIELTPKEFSLMYYLIENKHRVVSRNEIAEKVWNISFDTGTNIIEVYVSYLRNKIDKPFAKKLIHNKIGMGYFLKEE